MSAPHTISRAALTVLMASATTAAIPDVAFAEVPGVQALVKQGAYWKGKGRNDLADQALRRALALDPTNAEARRLLQGGTPAAPAKAAAPVRSAAAPTRPASAKPAPAPRPAQVARAKPAPAPAKQRAADNAGQQRMAGFNALDDNDLDGAAARFQKALGVNRNDGDALGGLGIVRLRQSRFTEARDLLEKAARQPNPDRWSEALSAARFFSGIEEARALVARGQVDQAQAKAEALVRSGYPQQALALELLADIYERQGRYADAADFYRQAGEQGGPQTDQRLQSRAARGRALAAMARGDDITAEQEFQGGLMVDQSDPWIRYEFARFLIRHGRSVEAESLIGSLTQSSDPDALYAAAMIDSDLGRNTAAQGLINRVPESQRSPAMRNFAIAIKTDSAIERAKAMAANGQRPQAIAALRQLGTITTLPAARRAAIASALFDLGDGAGAGQFAQAAMNGDISDLDGYDAVVRVLAKTGRDDLARAALQKAASLGNATPDGQRQLARMSAGLAVGQADRLRTAGQYAQAFDALRGAWGAAPDNLEILSALARLYQSGGMASRAAQTYQIVLTREGRDRDALIGLAQTAQAAGDRELSQNASERALRLFPQDYQVRMSLAQVAESRGDKSTAVRLLKEARALYARQNAGQPGATVPAFGGNPFGGAPAAVATGNPFRDQQMVQQPQVNPFALGNGTRLPQQSYAPGMAPSAYAPAPIARMSGTLPQPAFGQASGAGDGGYAPASYTTPAALDRPAAGQAQSGFQQAAYGDAYPQAQAYPVQAQTYPAQQGYQGQGYQGQGYQGQGYQAPQAYPAAPYQAQPYQAAPYQAAPYQAAPYQAQPYQAAPYQAQPFDSQYPAQTYPAQAYPGASDNPFAGRSSQAGYGGMAPLPGGEPLDPVMAKIQNDISGLTRESGPRADLATSYRERKGETGLSALQDIRGSAELSTGFIGGRVKARAEAVVIDSGRPTGSGLARFGTNATIEAQAIVNKQPSALVQTETQHKSGVALSAGFDSKTVQFDAGTTPIGMGKTKFSGRLAVTPSLGNGAQAQAWIERRPVTDSIISYAGTRDPVTGITWGQVMRFGGGAGLSVDHDGNGAYASVAYNTYRGTRVAHNRGIEANAGGYLKVMQTEHSRLTTGVNVNYQAFRNPQNYFTYGHGGYFSPQSFFSVSFPVSYTLDKDKLALKAGVTPGYQSYNQDEVALYPIDTARQAQLDGLKVNNSDVRARYDSLSKTGFALSAAGSLYYQIGPSTRIGGEASYNTFGSYDELRSTIGLRQSLGATK